MAAPRKYSEELKERATRLALDVRRDPASKVGAIKRIAEAEAVASVGSKGDWRIQLVVATP